MEQADLRQRIRSIAWIPQIIAGLLLVAIGYTIGRTHLDLIRTGARTQGRIVGFKTVSLRSGPSSSSVGSTAEIPLVEYQLGDRTVRFQDWLGGRRGEDKNALVPVLYEPGQPTVAMIDRPVMNWIPWGAIAGVGLFLVLVALPGLTRYVVAIA